jgi:hypothetical protein
MALFGFGGAPKPRLRKIDLSNDTEILVSELYDQSRNDVRLMLMYKKYEVAARIGDWELMNKLNSQFKQLQATDPRNIWEMAEV